jgi:REP element-mobilizing transposase RayT
MRSRGFHTALRYSARARVTLGPIRARIRRLYVPNSLYFTAVTQRRQPIFADESNLELLQETMRRVKEIHPFQMRAYVFLHDHFHL